MYGFRVPVLAQVAKTPASYAPNAFMRIDDSGRITLIIPQVEMGQGTYTSLSMILAEELDAEWRRVNVEHAPPDETLYANPMLGIQATGNSNSDTGILDAFAPSRRHCSRVPPRGRGASLGCSGGRMQRTGQCGDALAERP